MLRNPSVLPPDSFEPEFATELRSLVRCAAQRLVVSGEVIADAFGGGEVTPNRCDEAWKDRLSAAELICEFVTKSYDGAFGDMQQMHADESRVKQRERAWDNTWCRLLGMITADTEDDLRLTEGVAVMFDDLSRQHHRGLYGTGRFHAYAREYDPATLTFYNLFEGFIPKSPRRKR